MQAPLFYICVAKHITPVSPLHSGYLYLKMSLNQIVVKHRYALVKKKMTYIYVSCVFWAAALDLILQGSRAACGHGCTSVVENILRIQIIPEATSRGTLQEQNLKKTSESNSSSGYSLAWLQVLQVYCTNPQHNGSACVGEESVCFRNLLAQIRYDSLK